MISLSQLTELLGWVALINIGLLLFSTLMLVSMRPFITSIHSKMFGIPEEDLSILYFKYLANFKLLNLVFIIAPYVALKIMGQ